MKTIFDLSAAMCRLGYGYIEVFAALSYHKLHKEPPREPFHSQYSNNRNPSISKNHIKGRKNQGKEPAINDHVEDGI